MIEQDSNGDQEWAVESIVAQRLKGRRDEYLVAWVGYPPEENTWEPRSTVEDTAALDRWLASQTSNTTAYVSVSSPSPSGSSTRIVRTRAASRSYARWDSSR